jgi:hypothetical protein
LKNHLRPRSDEELEPVKKEKKKKPKKKPVIIVEESNSESDDESNVIYIKKRSNKKKVELAPVEPPVVRQEPIQAPQFQYPRNPFYSMPFRMI